MSEDPGYDRTFDRPAIDLMQHEPTAPMSKPAHLPELGLRAAALPAPADIRTRELLGVPIAMTDYGQAMDVMDGMIARREPGYICAVAVHALTVAHTDPEMKRALLGS